MYFVIGDRIVYVNSVEKMSSDYSSEEDSDVEVWFYFINVNCIKKWDRFYLVN